MSEQAELFFTPVEHGDSIRILGAIGATEGRPRVDNLPFRASLLVQRPSAHNEERVRRWRRLRRHDEECGCQCSLLAL
eukprot:scaffold109473_cov33-Tisochrysis_lutea.AAC.7